MTDVQFTPIDEDILDTILGDDVDFSGSLVFQHPLMIRGRVSGSIQTSSDLYIDEKAVVRAEIEAHDLSIRGRLEGNVRASGRVELFSCCHVEGDITAGEVSMETGCFYKGTCTMTGKNK